MNQHGPTKKKTTLSEEVRKRAVELQIPLRDKGKRNRRTVRELQAAIELAEHAPVAAVVQAAPVSSSSSSSISAGVVRRRICTKSPPNCEGGVRVGGKRSVERQVPLPPQSCQAAKPGVGRKRSRSHMQKESAGVESRASKRPRTGKVAGCVASQCKATASAANVPDVVEAEAASSALRNDPEVVKRAKELKIPLCDKGVRRRRSIDQLREASAKSLAEGVVEAAPAPSPLRKSSEVLQRALELQIPLRPAGVRRRRSVGELREEIAKGPRVRAPKQDAKAVRARAQELKISLKGVGAKQKRTVKELRAEIAAVESQQQCMRNMLQAGRAQRTETAPVVVASVCDASAAGGVSAAVSGAVGVSASDGHTQKKRPNSLSLAWRHIKYKSVFKRMLLSNAKYKYESGGREVIQKRYQDGRREVLQQKYKNGGCEVIRKRYREGGREAMKRKYVESGREACQKRYWDGGREVCQKKYRAGGRDVARKKYVERGRDALKQKYRAGLCEVQRKKYKEVGWQACQKKYFERLREVQRIKYQEGGREAARKRYIEKGCEIAKQKYLGNREETKKKMTARYWAGGRDVQRKWYARWGRTTAGHRYVKFYRDYLRKKYREGGRQLYQKWYRDGGQEVLQNKYKNGLREVRQKQYRGGLCEGLRKKYQERIRERRRKYQEGGRDAARARYIEKGKEIAKKKYLESKEQIKQKMFARYWAGGCHVHKQWYMRWGRVLCGYKYRNFFRDTLRKKYMEGGRDASRKKYMEGGRDIMRKKYKEGGRDACRKKYMEGGRDVLRSKYLEGGGVAARKKYREGGRERFQKKYKESGRHVCQKWYREGGKVVLKRKYEDKGRDVCRKKYREGGRDVARTKYREGGCDVAQKKYREGGRDAARKKYSEGGRNGARVKYREGGRDVARKKYHEGGRDVARKKYCEGGRDAARKKYIESGRAALKLKYRAGLCVVLRKKYNERLREDLREREKKYYERVREVLRRKYQEVGRRKYQEVGRDAARKKYIEKGKEIAKKKYTESGDQINKKNGARYWAGGREVYKERYARLGRLTAGYKYRMFFCDVLRKNYWEGGRDVVRAKYLASGSEYARKKYREGGLRERFQKKYKESIRQIAQKNYREGGRQVYQQKYRDGLRETLKAKYRNEIRQKYHETGRYKVCLKYRDTLQKKYQESGRQAQKEKYLAGGQQIRQKWYRCLGAWFLKKKYREFYRDVARQRYREGGRDRLQRKYRDSGCELAKKKYRQSGQHAAKQKYRKGGREVAQQKYKEGGRDVLKQKYREGGREIFKKKYKQVGHESQQKKYREGGREKCKQKYIEGGREVLKKKYRDFLRWRYQKKYEDGGREAAKRKYLLGHGQKIKAKQRARYSQGGALVKKIKYMTQVRPKRIASISTRSRKRPPGAQAVFVKTHKKGDEPWKDSALMRKNIEQIDSGPFMPPAWCSMYDNHALREASEFVEFFGGCVWKTCICCWKAWYSTPPNAKFSGSSVNSVGHKDKHTPWFCPDKSAILQQWCFGGKEAPEAQEIAESISQADALVECRCGARGVDAGFGEVCRRCGRNKWLRKIGRCNNCVLMGNKMRYLAVDPISETRKGEKWSRQEASSPLDKGGYGVTPEAHEEEVVLLLGRPLEEIAPPIACLTDFEEMVLALVHPLVQVFSIPRTGELAYVGHVCNFRQDVRRFMDKLPVTPQDMPFVMVRPRVAAGVDDRRPRRAFQVDISKLRRAYDWLKEHNPHYYNIPWDEEAAGQWTDEPELPVREEDIEQHQMVDISIVSEWARVAEQEDMSGGSGFQIGKKLVSMVNEKNKEIDGEDEKKHSAYYVLTDAIARAKGKDVLRVAKAINTADIAFVLLAYQEEGVVDDEGLEELRRKVDAVEYTEWPSLAKDLLAEISAVKVSFMDPDSLMETGVTEDLPADGDEVDRIEALDSLADVVGMAKPELKLKQSELPRVDAPRVDDRPGEAIAENTPGYIPKAFPKLFPHGVGDFHEQCTTRTRDFDFGEWGRHVLQWHDGRFMRHTRFRYWLLNTWLRMRTPGLRNVFWKTNPQAADLTFDDLKDRKKMRMLVQQMTTTTSNLPGTVGERRGMRQDLESLVNQKEVETADAGEAQGRGRLPAGFATFSTASVYKWEQLHEVILGSMRVEERERYAAWRTMPDGPGKEKARRSAYYNAAVSNPGVVSWYCAARLEATVKLACAVIGRQVQSEFVPGATTSREAIRQELAACLGEDVDKDSIATEGNFGEVDDYYATFEWSAGGMVHVHVSFWIVGSPRIDKVVIGQCGCEADKGMAGNGVTPEVKETVWAEDTDVTMRDGEAARALGKFFERIYTEWNVAKREDGDACRISKKTSVGKAAAGVLNPPDSITEKTLLSLLAEAGSMDQESIAELGRIVLDGPVAAEWPDIVAKLRSCGEGDISGKARARTAFLVTLAEWLQMHDFHEPFAQGRPSKAQSCCHVDHEHTAREETSCGKMFPRDLIPAACAQVKEDPRRRELYRLWLSRNCHFINNYVPLLLLATCSNMDFQDRSIMLAI